MAGCAAAGGCITGATLRFGAAFVATAFGAAGFPYGAASEAWPSWPLSL